VQNRRFYCFPFAFAALNFAHRAFVAFEIFALAATDITRFFLPIGFPPLATSRPKIFMAARTLSNCCRALSACFCNFASYRLNAAKMFMKPPGGKSTIGGPS
jgi:hypothetical protein